MAVIRNLGLRIDCRSGPELLGAQSNVSELWTTSRAHRLSVAVRPNNGLDCYNAIAYPSLIIATEHGPFRLSQSAHTAHTMATERHNCLFSTIFVTFCSLCYINFA